MDSWVETRMKSQLTCSGDLEMRRRIWVSVSILVGIRLRIATRRGRISWWLATSSSRAKMRSCWRIVLAGRPSGMLMGMRTPFLRLDPFSIRRAGADTAVRHYLGTFCVSPQVERAAVAMFPQVDKCYRQSRTSSYRKKVPR